MKSLKLKKTFLKKLIFFKVTQHDGIPMSDLPKYDPLISVTA